MSKATIKEEKVKFVSYDDRGGYKDGTTDKFDLLEFKGDKYLWGITFNLPDGAQLAAMPESEGSVYKVIDDDGLKTEVTGVRVTDGDLLKLLHRSLTRA